MNTNSNYIPVSGHLQSDVSDAVLNGYMLDLEINPDWLSFRPPDHPRNRASLSEGRLNQEGQIAFYLASGDYCGEVEVSSHFERIRCNVTPHTVHVFDLHRFSVDYGYTDAFVGQRRTGGWAICQQVSDYLTNHHGVSGVLYQSAALNQRGEFGYCMAILPGRENSLPSDFFIPSEG